MPQSAAAGALRPPVPGAAGAPQDPLTYPLDGTPAPGEALEVADGVLWLRMPLPFALDHINLWLLRDGPGWTIVDCGYTSEENRGQWEQVFSRYLDGRPVTRVIVTHYHPDHLGMAHWLTERFGVELWMTTGEFLTGHAVLEGSAGFDRDRLLALFRQHGLDRERLAALSVRNDAYRRGVPSIPGSYRRIRDGERIAIDGRDWLVVAGYGHSPEHAALYCPALDLVISGDMVLPRISTNVSVWGPEPESDPVGLFLDSLSRLRALPDTTLVLPSHGRVFRGLHPRIDALRSHHRTRLVELLAACREPATAAQVLPLLFRRALDNHQVFFAMGEAIAHLNYLWHRGLARRNVDREGVCRFSAVAAGSIEIAV